MTEAAEETPPARGADASSSRPAAAEPPRQFGHYELTKELGRGAQGVVFLAQDQRLGRKVALKLLSAAGVQSPLVRERFKREAALTSKLEHPGICGVHEFGEVEGVPYIAMQYVRGTTLASMLQEAQGEHGGGDPGQNVIETISVTGRSSKGEMQDVMRLIERAARALHTAHEAGLVHRDIKPANIMVTPEGDPVLLDFGLARDVEGEGQTLTQSGQIMGTPAYLAPEQIVASRGVVGRRTDVYALGVTLFECLTLQRPFTAQTWDQLFHDILNGTSPDPRKINPRIPQDLRTVIEVAMERDPARRYASAEAFADDLRRVRSFEPIRAKAAGPIARVRKWARRHPGKASSVAAALLFVLTGAGFFAAQALGRVQALRQHLQRAEALLAAGDHGGALEAVALARERAPDSAAVVELRMRIERAQEAAEREARRRVDLAAAVDARAEAARKEVEHAELRKGIEESSEALLRQRGDVLMRYASDAERATFARKERLLEDRRLEAERLLLRCEEALQQAARREAAWDGSGVETENAFADFFMGRWREALANGDTTRAAVMRVAVEQYDRGQRHQRELLGRGSLTVAVVPPDAEAFLFRYEPYDSVRPDGCIPRLVPVPTAGVGVARPGDWCPGFRPGDCCLRVTTVAPGSPAAQAGLRPGDLVLTLAGAPSAGTLRLREVAPDSPLAQAGARPLATIQAIDDQVVGSPFDWFVRVAESSSAERRIRIAGLATQWVGDPRQLPVSDPTGLIVGGAAVAMTLQVLRDGEPVEVDLPAGAPSGLSCEVTAYPLITGPANRIATGTALAVDPGSYLLLVRHGACEPQRLHVVVERLGEVSADVELLAAGATPPGFVYIPPGQFVYGGDPRAFKATPATVKDLPGFFIGRKEVTNREWYEFVNDPETLAKIARQQESQPGAHLYLPQDDRVMARQADDGQGWTWHVLPAPPDYTSGDTPVVGLTWADAHDFVEWRNQRAAAAGEPWRYDLPSQEEWEKAARGVDGRCFPWGNRFDPSLTVCMHRQSRYLLDAPGGFEPRDESPYGVLDTAGSREEWLKDPVPGSQSPRYMKRGGHLFSYSEILFRAASPGEGSANRFVTSQGFRLVARRQRGP